MDTRLHIATRIHYLLARQLGEGIDVGAMLEREDYAREVLFVCEAADDAELPRLAEHYRAVALLHAAETQRAAAAPQDAEWGANTSGFGVTQPLLPDAPARPEKRPAMRWLKPSTWLARLAS